MASWLSEFGKGLENVSSCRSGLCADCMPQSMLWRPGMTEFALEEAETAELEVLERKGQNGAFLHHMQITNLLVFLFV